MQIIHACRQLKCMSPGSKHVAKCLVQTRHLDMHFSFKAVDEGSD